MLTPTWRCVVLVSAFASGGAACGQISPIGPFTGPHTEGFETQSATLNELYTCLPDRIFKSTADLCDHESNAVVLPDPWALFCVATPHQGSRFALGVVRPVEISFDNAVTSFGGYFATVGGIDGAVVTFFDAAGSIGTALLTTDQCNWTWNGWQSTTPFTRVRIVGNTPFAQGGYIHMDDLEYLAGAQPCYANCDNSTAAPILNVNDFACFQTRFAVADPAANCDASTIPPVLNVNDFVCFQTAFAAGCP
jgi:hypothetical protein